ncbi:MBL fold metallo-hydrolase [Clostridium sp.]|uniref:MBL fold metallo-hydrolase n=1 Tax=Clostridium sp. TaxID=1506 RepID=UPI00260CCFE1|nr:MBL fold metallo-hydrolase [Clostridium sp.]
MIYLFSFLVLLCVGIVLFINLNPVFGGSPSKEQKEFYKHYDNYVNERFVNETQTSINMSLPNFLSMLKDSIIHIKDRNPVGKIPVSVVDWEKIKNEKNSLTWFGHSAFLLSIDNKKILIDPMLTQIPSPVSFIGSRRYKYTHEMLHIIEEMIPIDAVLITHDHYDHLDYKSIVKLESKVSHFFVPLGVSPHLIRWGVPKDKITELNWWDEAEFKGLTIASTPSKHFSGRGIFNRDTTLWGGLAVLGKATRVYISGDGGYEKHFKNIGDKYGPFNITLIEGSQYDRRWPWVHMKPEEAVQAHLDVKGKNMLMHWGAFTLAFHSWKEPIERAIKKAKKSEVNLIVPQIGKTVSLDSELNIPFNAWWNF